MSDNAHSHSFDGTLQGLIKAMDAHSVHPVHNRVELRTADGRLLTEVLLDTDDGETVVATLSDPDRGNEEPLGEVDYNFVVDATYRDPLQIILDRIAAGPGDAERRSAQPPLAG